MLAHPYGFPRVMSSFAFTNTNAGPPVDQADNILSPVKNGTCTTQWVCEHRWPQIAAMNIFRIVAKETPLQNWYSDGENFIAFSRGDFGFIAINGGNSSIDVKLQTGLPAGKYCDVITGQVGRDGRCTGSTIDVHSDGKARISINETAEDPIIAIHIGVSEIRKEFG